MLMSAYKFSQSLISHFLKLCWNYLFRSNWTVYIWGIVFFFFTFSNLFCIRNAQFLLDFQMCCEKLGVNFFSKHSLPLISDFNQFIISVLLFHITLFMIIVHSYNSFKILILGVCTTCDCIILHFHCFSFLYEFLLVSFSAMVCLSRGLLTHPPFHVYLWLFFPCM